jgi:hypothetical protein
MSFFATGTLLLAMAMPAQGSAESEGAIDLSAESGKNRTIAFVEKVQPAVDYLIHHGYSPTDPRATEMLLVVRAEGQRGLDLFNRRAVGFTIAPPQTEEEKAERQRIEDARDQIAGQRDSRYSGLFWYRDLTSAKAEAARTRRPILSLRLLGKLTDEYSCANSRYFRTALYADEDLAEYLRQNFVLHWSSERPVPTIVVDYGDGRQLRRTITGNSIHYVLDSGGRVIDGLPGLYLPSAFRASLGEARELAGRTALLHGAARDAELSRWHGLRASMLREGLSSALGQLGPPPASSIPVLSVASHPPTASHSIPLAFSKMRVEQPLANAFLHPLALAPDTIPQTSWDRIAETLHPEGTRKLNAGSRDLFLQKFAPEPGDSTSGARAIEAFEKSMAVDTVRNQFDLHLRIHEWLEANPGISLRELNARVYTELFKTPADDPWLGLAPGDAYAALEGNGLFSANDGLAKSPEAGKNRQVDEFQ